MRFPCAALGAAAAVALAAAAGCGYVGDPLPPALHIPMPVQDLRVLERGERLIVEFTVPLKTTEDLPVTRLEFADFRIGPGGNPFNASQWESGAAAFRIPVSAPGPVRHEIPAGDLAGKEVVAGVRIANDRGRASEWSNLVSLRVVPPLRAPAGLRAESAPAGVRLAWTQDSGVSARVFRRGPGDGEAVAVGEVQTAEYTDATAQFGTRYEYQVQAVRDRAESEMSEVAVIVPVDTFAPAVPSGVTAVAGVSSIAIAWERDTEPDLAGYRLYRATGDGAWELLETLDIPAYTDRRIESGKRYRYAVSAFDKLGNESPRSTHVEAVAP